MHPFLVLFHSIPSLVLVKITVGGISTGLCTVIHIIFNFILLVFQTTEQDIDHALKHFETHNGDIAQILLSASVFRRQHFEQEFLPKLLTPRVIPDVPDIKAKFINQLYSMNKISHSVYARYREACLAEARTLQGMVRPYCPN
jgi:hypothetical protein